MKPIYQMTKEELFSEFHFDANDQNGLSKSRVEILREAHGENKLQETKNRIQDNYCKNNNCTFGISGKH